MHAEKLAWPEFATNHGRLERENALKNAMRIRSFRIAWRNAERTTDGGGQPVVFGFLDNRSLVTRLYNYRET